jgi:hypothetical protein
MPLFHVQTGIPANVDLPYGRLVLRYSRHALKEASKDRHGDLRFGLPGEVLAHKARLVEVETHPESGRLTKVVYRVGMTKGLDLVLAMSPRADRWVVRTCWGNLKSDTHKTLNRGRYVHAVGGGRVSRSRGLTCSIPGCERKSKTSNGPQKELFSSCTWPGVNRRGRHSVRSAPRRNEPWITRSQVDRCLTSPGWPACHRGRGVLSLTTQHLWPVVDDVADDGLEDG